MLDTQTKQDFLEALDPLPLGSEDFRHAAHGDEIEKQVLPVVASGAPRLGAFLLARLLDDLVELQILKERGVSQVHQGILVALMAGSFSQRNRIRTDLGLPKARAFLGLVDGDAVIADSKVIAEYIEEKYPDPPLLPADPARSASIDRSEGRLRYCERHELRFPTIMTWGG